MKNRVYTDRKTKEIWRSVKFIIIVWPKQKQKIYDSLSWIKVHRKREELWPILFSNICG